MTSGKAGGLPFAGPSKGPFRKRVKTTIEQREFLTLSRCLLKMVSERRSNKIVSYCFSHFYDSRKRQTLGVPRQSRGFTID